MRFVGIEMYSTSTYGADPTHTPWPINGFTYYLLFGKSVSNVTVDRCYFHGSDTEDIVRGAGFGSNSSYIAVVDSDIRDIHGWNYDSQAFASWASPGPFKVVNNYLSASSEDVMFGGAGGYNNPFVPADIEIRHNHFYKPASWERVTSGTRPWQWTIKDNLECKSCLRILVTGNLMENVWYGSDQIGENIVLTPRTKQSGYTAVVDDVTIESNLLNNANEGFLIGGYDDNCHRANGCFIQGEAKRIVIRNNLILPRDRNDVGGYHPLGFSMWHRMDAMLIQHNTVQGIGSTQSWASIYFNNATARDHPTNVWILDNALSRQPTGDEFYQGQKALDTYMPLPAPDSVRFAGNVMFVPSGDNLATWPLYNYATTVPFTFVDPSSGNYQLVTPAWTDTSNAGKIAGVDMGALNVAMNP